MIAPGCPSVTIHNTRVAYVDHRCRCPRALELNRDYDRSRRERLRFGPLLVDPVGTARRVRALAAIGWTTRTLGAHLGVDPAQVGDWAAVRRSHVQRSSLERVRTCYEALREAPGPSASAQTLALNKGWVSPIRWLGKDMDDPDEHPWPAWAEPDWVAVERMAAGQLGWRDRSRLERRLAVQRLRARGMTTNAIGMRLEDTADPDANAMRMVERDLAWLRSHDLSVPCAGQK